MYTKFPTPNVEAFTNVKRTLSQVFVVVLKITSKFNSSTFVSNFWCGGQLLILQGS